MVGGSCTLVAGWGSGVLNCSCSPKSSSSACSHIRGKIGSKRRGMGGAQTFAQHHRHCNQEEPCITGTRDKSSTCMADNNGNNISHMCEAQRLLVALPD